MGEGRGNWCNPQEPGPPQQKTAENFSGFRNIRTRYQCLTDSSLGVKKQQWHCTGEAMTRTGDVVEPRKIRLAFYFVQDTKLSSGSAAGCPGLMNVSQRVWVCREPRAALQASLLRWRQAAVSTGPGCWAEQLSLELGFPASLGPHFK